jgi:hypothetical protein
MVWAGVPRQPQAALLVATHEPVESSRLEVESSGVALVFTVDLGFALGHRRGPGQRGHNKVPLM